MAAVATPTPVPSATWTATSSPTATNPASGTPTATETPPAPKDTATPTVTPTPIGHLTGRVSYVGTPTAGQPVILCAWSGADCACQTRCGAVAGTDGSYRLPVRGDLRNGTNIYVRWQNATLDTRFLAEWTTLDVPLATVGGDIAAGDFDIQNVPLIAPADRVSRTLPVDFTGQTRGLTGDSYRLGFVDPRGGQTVFASADGQATTQVALATLPIPVNFGVDWGWFVERGEVSSLAVCPARC